MLKLKKITEDMSEKLFDMFQEIPYDEPTQDRNIANGLDKETFRKYCAMLELADKNILLSYKVPQTTYYILFDDDTPIGWFLLKQEKLPEGYLHAGHIGYTIRPSKRNMGYGTKGLNMMLDIAKNKGYKCVCVTTDDINTPSVKMLYKLGFKKLNKNNSLQILTKKVYDKMSQYKKDLKN
ncbi:MAG: GNAT family N-acetyltransferase [Clostridia bacterium]|nr:GNAT family N-acetyltransferase [Clostridia bacterium]